MNLLYLTFGNNTDIHTQAAFSIYSFLTRSREISSVNVITDNAALYKHFGSGVNVISVTNEELSDWKGEYQFFWRIKIKAIEMMCHLYPGQPIVYLDADTFLYSDIEGVKKSLLEGTAFMHENEGPLSAKKSKTEKKMWRQIREKEFGSILMQASDCMWNAGVVATPNTHNGKDCELALNICDEMCGRGITRRLIEQYALSLALNKSYGLTEAKTVIAHYWSVKDLWNRYLNNLFLEAYFAGLSDEAVIEKVSVVCKSNIPISQKTKNTNVRLKAVIDKIFPVSKVQYLQKKQ